MCTHAQVPLFPGDCELRQLLHIFKLLGTPKEDEWAGVSQLRDWHEFPNWRPQSLEEHFPTLEPAGVDLIRELFIYDPAKRVTVSLHQIACHFHMSESKHSIQRVVPGPTLWRAPDGALTCAGLILRL
jgi:hypothetical protein